MCAPLYLLRSFIGQINTFEHYLMVVRKAMSCLPTATAYSSTQQERMSSPILLATCFIPRWKVLRYPLWKHLRVVLRNHLIILFVADSIFWDFNEPGALNIMDWLMFALFADYNAWAQWLLPLLRALVSRNKPRAQTNSSPSPPGFVLNNATLKCYKYVSENATQIQADAIYKSLGLNGTVFLATANSAADNAFLSSICNWNSCWIGLKRKPEAICNSTFAGYCSMTSQENTHKYTSTASCFWTRALILAVRWSCSNCANVIGRDDNIYDMLSTHHECDSHK
jgi:hypothetical protein